MAEAVSNGADFDVQLITVLYCRLTSAQQLQVNVQLGCHPGICTNLGCGNRVSNSICCVRCPASHTPTCRARAEGQPVAPAAEGQPVAPAAESAAEECPLCFEDCTSFHVALCGHQWCLTCQNEAGSDHFTTCPFCREVLEPTTRVRRELERRESEATSLRESLTAYVVLRAPRNQTAIGWHRCSWRELERRLEVPPMQLSGQLSHFQVTLRRADTRELAEIQWNRKHPTQMMPEH